MGSGDGGKQKDSRIVEKIARDLVMNWEKTRKVRKSSPSLQADGALRRGPQLETGFHAPPWPGLPHWRGAWKEKIRRTEGDWFLELADGGW